MMIRSSIALLTVSIGLAACGGGGSAGSSALPQTSTNSSSVTTVPVSKYVITLTNVRGPQGGWGGTGASVQVTLPAPGDVDGTVSVASTVSASSHNRGGSATPSPSPTTTADPLAGLTVTATDAYGNVDGTTTTAADGSFQLDLPAGTFVIAAQ